MNDWTIDPQTGRSNSGELFLALRREVECLIRGSAHDLINDRAGRVAGLIMAQLAHRYGLAPVTEAKTWRVLHGEAHSIDELEETAHDPN